MKKRYTIKQTYNLNGTIHSPVTSVFMTEADVTVFVGLLDGGVQVTEVNTSLTNMSKADTVLTETNQVRDIRMSGVKADGEREFSTIKSFNKSPLAFKDKAVTLKTALATIEPFGTSEALKPSSIIPSLY